MPPRLSRTYLVVLALALLCASACAPRRPRPNVLLVTLDTLRADHLGCYGDLRAETPAIDGVARAGTLFTRAYSPVPLTLPAHATMFTGLEPPAHGLVDNGMTSAELGAATLAERLQAAGYDTGAFISAFVLNRVFGLSRGFAHYDDGPAEEAELEGLFRRVAPGEERVDAALAWLDRPRAAPFFLWLHLYDAHAPHVAPGRFAQSHAARPYAGEVAYLDSQVRRLLDVLEARGLTRDTLVVLTSDHGEGLGEHGEWTHGFLLHDATLHVPLILRWPGRLPVGRRDERPVALVDLAPTVLDLLGLAPNPRRHGRRLFNGEVTAGWERVLWAQSDYPARQYGWGALRSVRRGDWKYVDGPRPQLFDLRRDPRELLDLNEREPRRAAELRALVGPTEDDLRRARPNAALHEPDADARARLQALGYMAGGPEQTQGRATERSAARIDPRDGLQRLAGMERAFEALERGGDGLGEAERALRSLTRRFPHDGQLQLGLGRTLELLGQGGEARRAYLAAAEAESTRVLALARLVALAQARGDVVDELAAARRLATVLPRHAPAQRRLAQALARAGQREAALATFEVALQLDPRGRLTRLAAARFALAEPSTIARGLALAQDLEHDFPGDGEVAALRAPTPTPH
jgi:arylsulfatase A-like enzyme